MSDREPAESTEELASVTIERVRYEVAMAIIRYHEDPNGFYQEASSFVAELDRSDNG